MMQKSSLLAHAKPAELSREWEYAFLPSSLATALRFLDAAVSYRDSLEGRIEARFYSVIVLFVMITCPISWFFLTHWEKPHGIFVGGLLATAAISIVVLIQLASKVRDLPSIRFIALGLGVLIGVFMSLSGGLASGAMAILAPLALFSSESLERKDAERALSFIKWIILAAIFVSLFPQYFPKVSANTNPLYIISYCCVVATAAMLLFAYVNICNVTLKELKEEFSNSFDAETGCLDMRLYDQLLQNPRFSRLSSALSVSLNSVHSGALPASECKALVMEAAKYLKDDSLYFFGGGQELRIIIPLEQPTQLERIRNMLTIKLVENGSLAKNLTIRVLG